MRASRCDRVGTEECAHEVQKIGGGQGQERKVVPSSRVRVAPLLLLPSIQSDPVAAGVAWALQIEMIHKTFDTEAHAIEYYWRLASKPADPLLVFARPLAMRPTKLSEPK